MDRNEMLTALQLSRGMKIVSVQFITPAYDPLSETIDLTEAPSKHATRQSFVDNAARVYRYKMIGFPQVQVKDLVVVQVRNGAAVAVVKAIESVVPAEVPPGLRMRYVIGVVDLMLGTRLDAEDQSVLDQLQAAEVKLKLRQFREQMGIDLESLDTPLLTASATSDA